MTREDPAVPAGSSVTVTTDQDGTRWYHSPRQHSTPLPSVTSVLHATMPAARRAALAAWRERMGPEAAEVSAHAAGRGTCHHLIMEALLHRWPESRIADRLAGHEQYQVEEARSTARSCEPFVGRVRRVLRTEWPVVCPPGPPDTPRRVPAVVGGFAGTVDLHCVLLSADGRDERFAVVDWKTAGAPKDPESIGDYRLQVAAYAGAINILARRQHGAGSPVWGTEPRFLADGRQIAPDGTPRPIGIDEQPLRRTLDVEPQAECGAIVVAVPYGGAAQVFEMDRDELSARWAEWCGRLERFWKDRERAPTLG